MGKIVAIGGGEIGRPGYPVETTEIDEEIIRLSGKSAPKFLFIPTATSDSELYCDTVRKYFGRRLGCEVDVLYLLENRPAKKELEEKVLSSDIVYVGGGDTLKMMIAWRKHGVDKILERAYRRDIVLSGLSAGAICWFRYGSSDSRRFTKPSADLIKVRGLNFINALYCPHYNSEQDRKAHLNTLMKKTPGVAVAVDDCCAVEFLDDEYRVITSKSNANAYKVCWRKGEFHEEIIEKKKEFSPIKRLLTKL